LVVVVLWWVGPAKWWSAVRSANVLLFVAGCSMVLPVALAKGWRWQQILRAQGLKLSLRETTGIYSAGILAGAVTPGKVGDLLKVSFLVERKAAMGTSVAAVLVDRLVDAGLMVLLGFCGVLLIPGLPRGVAIGLGIGGGIGTAGTGVLLWFPGVLDRALDGRAAPRWADRAVKELATFRGALRAVGPRWWPSVAIGSLAAWVPYYVAVWLCTRALSLEIPVILLVASVSVAAVLAMLPVTVAGVGTRDATFALLLGSQGVSAEAALALSSLVLATMAVNCGVFFVLSRLCLRASNVKHQKAEPRR